MTVHHLHVLTAAFARTVSPPSRANVRRDTRERLATLVSVYLSVKTVLINLISISDHKRRTIRSTLEAVIDLLNVFLRTIYNQISFFKNIL